jgi:hypothetical protein
MAKAPTFSGPVFFQNTAAGTPEESASLFIII